MVGPQLMDWSILRLPSKSSSVGTVLTPWVTVSPRPLLAPSPLIPMAGRVVVSLLSMGFTTP